METCYGSSTSYLMTWLWIPHASSRSSTYECGGLLRTFHLFSPRVSHSNTCRLLSLFVLCCCLSCCLVFVFLTARRIQDSETLAKQGPKTQQSKNRKQKHTQATKPNNNTKQTKDKSRQVLECETRGEKRVKRPKQPNALICRTPGGSMRYP